MEEIISRWASDLSKYQKEFQDQAAKVSKWDRLLVENGDKIQKLYTSTFEAERGSAEVERQLSLVESQQNELESYLDLYEAQVDEMFARQVGPGESLQGPDQEREKTYKMAEKLTDRLDEMGKDLTSMIQEINTASAALSKTSKPDDPVSLPHKANDAVLIFTKAFKNCSSLEWPSSTTAMDRSERCSTTGKGRCSSKIRTEYGLQWLWHRA
jgi:nuclear pore complex protein Nup62